MFAIGFAGQARSGKTTAATHLLSQLPDRWVTAAFADPIKAMLLTMGVSCVDELKDVVHPLYGQTPRYMMQTLGTQWGRNMIGDNTWVNAFYHRYETASIIVSDVRYENEAQMVRDNGVLIHIRNRGGIDSDHDSEKLLDIHASDFIIDNSGELLDLYDSLSTFTQFNDR